MPTLNFSCQKQVLTMDCPDRLVVADSRKQVYANFFLDDEWNGLTVVAIFSNAWETIRKEVLLTEMRVEIPPSVLTDPGFRVSLNGIGDGGNVLLSTKYMTKPISVHRAGSLVCLQAPDADPELWQQALAAIGPLSNLDTEDKSSLVAAINEALKSGGGAITSEAISTALGYAPAPIAVVRYNTERLPFTKADGSEASTSDVDAAFIWSLYDALMDANPQLVKKHEIYNDDKTFVNFEYVISTGEYSMEGERGKADTDIRKPKYLVQTCIHGNERPAAISAYRFFRDVVNGANVFSQFREGAVFHVLPVVTPSSVERTRRDGPTSPLARCNEPNNVDVNRNFPYNWMPGGEGTARYSGTAAASEPETQAVINWLKANSDADAHIDIHNSANEYEVTMFAGNSKSDAVRRAKRIAMRGIDRIIPFWRDEKGYKPDSIFSYSASTDELYNGLCIEYASEVLKIPSIAMEININQNKPSNEYVPFAPETIAAGAEALGNVLLEFYEQSINSDQIELPKTENGDANYGTEGQFAVSDGKGGIKWLTAFKEDEVAY